MEGSVIIVKEDRGHRKYNNKIQVLREGRMVIDRKFHKTYVEGLVINIAKSMETSINWVVNDQGTE